MEKNSDFTAQQLFQSSVKEGLPVVKFGKAKLIKHAYFKGMSFVLFSFPNQTYTGEIVQHKTQCLSFGEYVLTHAMENSKDEKVFNFAKLNVYSTETGYTEDKSHEAYGEFDISKIIILNQKILVVSGDIHTAPRFFTVVASKLTEISAVCAENILRLEGLTKRHQLSLIDFCKNKGYEIHNGIIINPQTLDVPSVLQCSFWLRARRTNAEPHHVDFTHLLHVLTRNDKERPVIKYLTV